MANTLLGLFRAASGEDPLTDVKTLEEWLLRQPRNDYLATSEAMVRVLEDVGARQPKLSPGRVLALLELDRASTAIQARLLKQYLLPALSDQVRQRLWHALDDLARWFAYSYENAFESMLGGRVRGHMNAITSRMFYYRGQQARNGLFRYEKWIPGRWKGLHAAYEAALHNSVARTPFRLIQDTETEATSAEQEYAMILLLQRINTGNLNPWQIDQATQWLRQWGARLAFTDPPERGEGFWLDLGLGDGLLIRRPQSAQGRILHLDVDPLQHMIADALGEVTLRAQRAPPDKVGDAGERMVLLQKVQSLWRPQLALTPRRGIRVKADGPIQVAPGLTEIAASLRGSKTADSTDRRFRLGDPSEAAAGNAETGGVAEAPGVDYQRRALGAWRMQDASESGVRLVSQSAEAGQQKLGSLLGLLDEGQTRWRVGIVRRLKKFSGGVTELGVEIVAHHCLLISPKPLASRNTGYSVDGIDVSVENKNFDALYLPPANTPGRVAIRSMVVPSLEFGERRRLFLMIDNVAYTIELTTALERNKDWVWTAFEVVREAA